MEFQRIPHVIEILIFVQLLVEIIINFGNEVKLMYIVSPIDRQLTKKNNTIS